MPEIIICAAEGRAHEKKKALVEETTASCVRHLDTPAEAVVIQFVKYQRESKAKGGVLFSDMTPDDIKRIFPNR
jgi:4-oxalocrotonate tautomerase